MWIKEIWIRFCSGDYTPPALAEAAKGCEKQRFPPVERDGVVLVTKVGYVQSESQFKAVSDLGLKDQMIKIEGGNGYCIAPAFIKH